MSFSSNKTSPNNIDLDSSQTLENKTLTSSTTIDSGATITTPAIIDPTRSDVKKDTYANLAVYAASASNGQMVFATDTKVMYQVVDSALTEVGSGSGGINYLSGDNSSFDNGTGDWTDDTNLGISLVSAGTSLIRGSGSLLISKDGAVSGATQTVNSPVFTVEPADLAKKMIISFDYNFDDPNYADGDARVQIVQDPNGTPKVIRVNGEDIMAGKGTHYAQFQTDSVEDEYQLQIYWVDSGLDFIISSIDNVQIGPQRITHGTIVTDWEEFTPVFTNLNLGTGAISKFNKKRVGDRQFVNGMIRLGAGGSLTGVLYMDLPNSADTSKFAGDTSFSRMNSNIYAYDISVGVGPEGRVLLNSGSKTQVYIISDGLPSWNSTAPFTWGQGDEIYFNFDYPVQGWSSNAKMSEDLGGRDIGNARRTISNTTIPNGVIYVPIDLYNADSSGSNTGNIPYQDGIGYNSGTGTFTTDPGFIVPETGRYLVSGNVHFSASSGDTQLIVIQDGSSVGFIDRAAAGVAGALTLAGSKVVKLTKGSLVSLGVYVQSTGGTLDASSGSMGIEKLASAQTILENETVAARYTSNSGQSIAPNVLTTIIFEDLEADTHNAMDTATGIYTVPVSGYYQVHAYTALAGRSTHTGRVYTLLECTGSHIDSPSIDVQEGDAIGYDLWACKGSVMRRFEKGDTFKVRMNQGTTVSKTLNVSGISVYIEIHRIK